MKKKDAIALLAAFFVLIIILILPNPDSLPLVGQRALAVLAFAVVLWVTEAVSYPVSAPQNMLAYGTGTFTLKQFIKSGVPLTVIGYLLIILFSATYWQWVGLL